MKKPSRRTIVGGLVAGAFLNPVSSYASQYTVYSAAALSVAQKAGKKVVVFFYAPWCPQCNAQKPILLSLLKESKYKDFTVFEVDYDETKTLRYNLNIKHQSTIIVYRGSQEVSRTSYITEKEKIAATLDTAFG